MKLRPFLATLLVSPLLAACGLKGDLERPPPMFDKAKHKAEIDRENAAKEAEKHKQEPPGGSQPAAPPPIAPIGSGPLAPPAPP